MDFLGVGPMEIIFILIIALIVLGPKDMVKAGRSIGRFLRKVVQSPTWQAVQQTSRDMRYLPNKLMREAGLEEEVEELKQIGQEVDSLSKSRTAISDDLKKATQEINRDLSAWTTPPTIQSPPPPALENKDTGKPADREPEKPTEEPASSNSEDPPSQ